MLSKNDQHQADWKKFEALCAKFPRWLVYSLGPWIAPLLLVPAVVYYKPRLAIGALLSIVVIYTILVLQCIILLPLAQQAGMELLKFYLMIVFAIYATFAQGAVLKWVNTRVTKPNNHSHKSDETSDARQSLNRPL